MPNVAPRCPARVRTKSSAAPRVAPTTTISDAGGVSRTNWRAASSRTAAEEERTIRKATLPSGRRAGHPGQASARWPGTDDSIKPGVTTGVAAGDRPEGRRLDKARRQDEFASLVSAPTQVKRHGPHVPAA